jgi:hypothetical protein
MAQESGFLGTGWAFPPAFDARTKQAAMASAEADIEQSLHILLGTTPGERVMQPSYGCGLKRMVFETLDENRITEIKDLVTRAVLFFEVRIDLDAVEIDTSELPSGLLRLHLAYTIRSTNSRHNLVYPLYLNEGSGVGFTA